MWKPRRPRASGPLALDTARSWHVEFLIGAYAPGVRVPDPRRAIAARVATTPAPFTEKRVSSDAMPPAGRSLDVDASSSRYQGLANGMRVYLTRQTDGAGVCIVAVPESEGAVAACSASGAAVTLTVPQGELRFRNDGFGEEEGAGDKVSDYVRYSPVLNGA